MANYETLKSAIQDVVKTNGNNEITGALLQQTLLAMINSLGAGYQFMGVAIPSTNPGTSDQRVFYIANGKGTYTNFGGISIAEDEVIILYYDTAWHKLLTGIASQEKLTGLEEKVNGKQDALTLTVKDNGNIVIANIQGQSKEFMPATPSGDPMHYAYIAAGAEYNDTGADIVKDAPWADMIDDDYTGDYGKTVVHKAGYWYLNGLGDITNEEMNNILLLKYWYCHNTNSSLVADNCRVLVTPANVMLNLQYAFTSSSIVILPYIYPYIGGMNNGLLYYATKLVHILSFNKYLDFSWYNKNYNDVFTGCKKLMTFKIKNIKFNISLNMTSYLSVKSVLYMINNEAATSPITITLHNTVYTRCMANADILAALEAHTNVSLASA